MTKCSGFFDKLLNRFLQRIGRKELLEVSPEARDLTFLVRRGKEERGRLQNRVAAKYDVYSALRARPLAPLCVSRPAALFLAPCHEHVVPFPARSRFSPSWQ